MVNYIVLAEFDIEKGSGVQILKNEGSYSIPKNIDTLTPYLVPMPSSFLSI